MEASELRFGNLVYDTKGEINIIDLEAITYVSVEPKNQVKPIPLTEEWLLKLGFEYRGDRYYFLQDGNISTDIQLRSFDTLYISGEDREDGDWEIIKSIKHVHQLQNFYFALTDEELTND